MLILKSDCILGYPLSGGIGAFTAMHGLEMPVTRVRLTTAGDSLRVQTAIADAPNAKTGMSASASERSP